MAWWAAIGSVIVLLSGLAGLVRAAGAVLRDMNIKDRISCLIGCHGQKRRVFSLINADKRGALAVPETTVGHEPPLRARTVASRIGMKVLHRF